MGTSGRSTLTGGLPVRAAGEARFVNGQLRAFNNNSGHYRPHGSESARDAERAFDDAGFEAAGKYRGKF